MTDADPLARLDALAGELRRLTRSRFRMDLPEEAADTMDAMIACVRAADANPYKYFEYVRARATLDEILHDK